MDKKIKTLAIVLIVLSLILGILSLIQFGELKTMEKEVASQKEIISEHEKTIDKLKEIISEHEKTIDKLKENQFIETLEK